MAEEGGDPLEGKELEFTIEVSCRKGEPVPQSTLGLTALSKQDTAEGAEEENDEEKEEEHVPTFEELGCQFHLTMFDGEAMVSEVLQFNAEPPEEPEAAEGEEGEEGQEKKEKKPHDPNLWTHTFTTTATINEDAIVKICKSAQSSISLRREDLEVPLVLLPLDLCAMVAGERVLEFGVSLAHTELYEDPFNVAEFNVKISIPEALLTNELEEKLNPLCITIVAAEDMPDHAKYELGGTWKDGKNPSTRSLAELQQECLPVYCKYTFMQPPPPKPKSEEKEQEEEEVEHPDWCCEVVTNSLPQSRKVKFKHKKVFLAGLIHPDDLIQHLKDNKIVVEVHDRDRIPPVSKQGSEESNGDGGEEQETPAIPVWSGLASIDKARAEEPLLENPYAVCAISLAPLCDGRQFVVERNDLGPKRINYPAFSAHIKPTLGDYVESGSVLVVKAELRRPLRSATLFPSGPFQRVVYKIQYSNAGMLTKLNESIVRANCAALSKRTKIEPPPTPTPRSSKEEKEERAKWEENPDAEGPPVNEMVYNMVQDGAPLSMLEKALNGVEITPEQAQDPEFDIITGVEVIDSNNRIFILEGLASGAILKLLEDCPREGKNTREMKVLYNQEITFTQRLYGAYNVSVKKIKLRESLRHLILKVDTYLEPKYMLTAGALMRLNEISRAGRMKKLRDLVLFPSVAQLEHMYKKLGDALSIEDLTGRKPENKVKKGHEDDMPELTKEELAAATAMPRPKAKAPTESHNPVSLLCAWVDLQSARFLTWSVRGAGVSAVLGDEAAALGLRAAQHRGREAGGHAAPARARAGLRGGLQLLRADPAVRRAAEGLPAGAVRERLRQDPLDVQQRPAVGGLCAAGHGAGRARCKSALCADAHPRNQHGTCWSLVLGFSACPMHE